LLTDRDKIGNLYRVPSIYVSYKILVHLAKQFQRRFLEIDQSERSIAYGGHVCLWIKTKCALFVEDLPGMLPTTFRFIWPSGFREKVFLEIDQSETRIVGGGHVCQ
jgi:hypothetical protein